jgi:hypothetical protein
MCRLSVPLSDDVLCFSKGLYTDCAVRITFNATATVSTANITCNDTSWTTSAKTAEQGGSSEEDLWERKVVCGPVNITFQADYLSAWE